MDTNEQAKKPGEVMLARLDTYPAGMGEYWADDLKGKGADTPVGFPIYSCNFDGKQRQRIMEHG